MAADRARIVLLHGNNILLMHRIKPDEEFFTITGGILEQGETPEEGAVREVREETGQTVEIERKLGTIHTTYQGEHTVHVFLARTNDPHVELIGEERDFHSPENQYLLEWHPLAQLPTLPLYPEGVRQLITQIT